MKTDPEDTNSSVDKKRRKAQMAKKTGKCPICPPHSVENGPCKAFGRRPRSDKHKNKR